MDLQKKYKIIIWVAITLFALNLATIASLFYHTRQDDPKVPAENADIVAERTEKGSSYFRDMLGLDSLQVVQFREINRSYNRATHFIARELEDLRIEMVDILGSDIPDTLKLNRISREIGNKHEELKRLTVTYYLGMKAVCRPDQQEALRQVFHKMVDKEVPLPPGRGMGRGRPYRGGRPAE